MVRIPVSYQPLVRHMQYIESSFIIGLLQSSSLGSMLDQLSNVTILAPNNDALSSLLNDSTAASALSDSGAVNALLSYHILNGTHYAADFTNMSMFIPTYLTNETYANITGGQRVEAVLADNNVTFFSGLRNNATVVTPVSLH